jgi:thiol-disulfide isomerase/thioredoxin
MGRDYLVLYQKYKNKYLKLKNEQENVNTNQQGGGNKKDVLLFKAKWCGHCQGFLPAWSKLKKEHNSKYNFITYDSDKHPEEIKSWNIEGFPTIMVKKGNEAMEYVGPNEYTSVLSFIENI